MEKPKWHGRRLYISPRMTRKHIERLTFLLYAIFAFMVISGVVLLFADRAEAAPTPAPRGKPSEVEIQSKKEGVSVKVKSDSGAVVLVSLGTVGLILLTIKVPVRWVSYRRSRKSSSEHMMHRSISGPVSDFEAEFSDVQKLPILVWWLVKKRAPLVRDD